MVELKGMHFNHDFYVVGNNKRTLVNLYKYIALVTRVRIFCTNNNIKVVIQMHAFLMDQLDLT